MSKEEVYITIGVKTHIPLDVMKYMLEMVKEMEDKDYLQVFRIQPINDYSIIKITQEVPSYEKSIKIGWKSEQELKLFYIDNVLMLADEY